MLRNVTHEKFFHFARTDDAIIELSRSILKIVTGKEYAVTASHAQISIVLDSFFRAVGYVCEDRLLIWTDFQTGWQDRFRVAAQTMAFPNRPKALIQGVLDELQETTPNLNPSLLVQLFEQLADRFVILLYSYMNGIKTNVVYDLF